MSFGFSVGDFVAALELVGTVIHSLRESGGAASEFRELVHELYGLETALLRVKQLDLDDGDKGDYVALTQAASQCQFTIDAFWSKASRFQRHLLTDASGPSISIKSAWMKVRWTLCRKEDVAKLKADIGAHTQSILLLLVAVQMKQDRHRAKESQAQLGLIGSIVQEAAQQCVGKLSEMSSTLGFTVSQGSKILQSTTRILGTNIRVFQKVCAIHTLLLGLPRQVERDLPVYMIDALGKTSPFHLEFVRSPEASRAVLQSNFERVPSGLRKIRNGEFVIQDAANGRIIDLSQSWEGCFAPGQRVDMRMVFHRAARRRNTCPSCRRLCSAHQGHDSRCLNCGLTFRRVEEVHEPSDTPSRTSTKPLVQQIALMTGESAMGATAAGPVVPKTAFDESEDVRFYRRVQVLERRKRKAWHRKTAALENDCKEDGEKMDIDQEAVSEAAQAEDTPHEEVQASIDLATFNQVLEMDEDDVEREFSREVICSYLASLREHLEQMRQYLTERDFQSLTQISHFVKGSVATLGFYRMRDLASELQGYGADENHPVGDRRPWDIFEALEAEVKLGIEKMAVFFRMTPEEIENWDYYGKN